MLVIFEDLIGAIYDIWTLNTNFSLGLPIPGFNVPDNSCVSLSIHSFYHFNIFNV